MAPHTINIHVVCARILLPFLKCSTACDTCVCFSRTHSLAQYANEVDIGIAPACGLQSPTVFSCDMDAQDDVCSRKDVEMKDMNGSLVRNILFKLLK